MQIDAQEVIDELTQMVARQAQELAFARAQIRQLTHDQEHKADGGEN